MLPDDPTAPGVLSAALTPALATALERQVTGVPDAEVVGLGVFTDADATSIVAVANTRAHLDAMVAAKPRYAADQVWDMGAWWTPARDTPPREPDPLHGFEAAFGQVHDRLQGDADAGAPVMASRRFIWDAILAALVDLRAGGFFARWPNAVIEMDAYDAEIDFEEIAGWGDRLNPPEVARGFRAFLGIA